MKPAATPTAGFTLLEVLIALVVLSIGLLGLAALQATGLRYNHGAYLRTQVALQALDMADRMRANRKGMVAGDYDNPPAVPHANCLTTAGCMPSDMAENDLYQWNDANSRLLPSGTGMVCRDSTPDDGTPSSPACDGARTLYVGPMCDWLWGVGLSSPTCDALSTLYAIKIWWDDDRGGQPKRFVFSVWPSQ